MLVDIHTHIDQHAPAEVPEIVARAQAAGVGAIVVAGTTVSSSRRCVEMAAGDPALFAGVGVHPQDLGGELSGAELEELEQLAAGERVVVMSEVGLDFEKGSPDRAMQERAFRAQIDIARQQRLAVVWHMRESTAETLRVLREERVWELGGAAHYFQGSESEAREVIDLGCRVSLAKPLLRIPELQEVAKRIPLSSIVLETDSYPQPFKKHRHRWTEPRDVAVVAAKLAELRGIDLAEVREATTANALEMMGEKADALRRGLEAAVPDEVD